MVMVSVLIHLELERKRGAGLRSAQQGSRTLHSPYSMVSQLVVQREHTLGC